IFEVGWHARPSTGARRRTLRDRLRGRFAPRRRKLARERGRGRQSGDLQYLLLVERLPLHERSDQRVERASVLFYVPPRLVMALPDDALHLRIDQLRRLLAVWPGYEHAAASNPIVRPWRELDHTQLIAHAPAGHHLAGERCRLFNVVLGAGGAAAVDDLLCGAATEHADDASPQVVFRVVVSVGGGRLIGHAQRLPAWHDRHPVDGVCPGYDDP